MDHKDLRLASHHFHLFVMNPEPDIGRLLKNVSSQENVDENLYKK